jgi:hypothetical protein
VFAQAQVLGRMPSSSTSLPLGPESDRSSVPGSTKNSISICSNSRIRKMKFPGVISLRNDFPTCAIPNGTFLRAADWICTKSTNIPWAVSGRR